MSMLTQSDVFNGFIGQDFTKNVLYDMYLCTVKYNQKFPHTLLVASAGQGKTKLSCLLCKALNPNFVSIYGPSISNWEDMITVLHKIKHANDVLFIDEIHGLPKDVQELLYPIMTDNKYYDKKLGAYVSIPKFSIIGATTDPQYLLRPFFDRFSNLIVFHKYSKENLKEMLSAVCKPDFFDEDVIDKLIELSHKTPRKLYSLLNKLDYFVGARSIKHLTMQQFTDFMVHCGLDDNGFNPLQQQYVSILKKANSPVSLGTLANLMELKQEVITNIIEPDIIASGCVTVSSSGRKWRQV